MSRVIIDYDLDKDIQNYIYGYFKKNFPSYGRDSFDVAPNLSQQIKNLLSKEKSADSKTKIIREYLNDKFFNKSAMNISIKSIVDYWGSIEKEFFHKLYSYMDAKKEISEINAYITTLSLCPYNHKERYFYIPFHYGIAIQSKVIMHESMHLVFLENYHDYLVDQGLNEESIADINESLTILLNKEFYEFLLSPEFNNKPSTQDLQKLVNSLYDEGKKFKEILDNLIISRQ